MNTDAAIIREALHALYDERSARSPLATHSDVDDAHDALRRAEKAEHFHVCFDEDCNRVLVGKGRNCDGEPESHRRETW